MSGSLRGETRNPSFRKELREKVGTVCSNCGSKTNIEYHHIVPLKFGGSNKITNFTALCSRCHKAAHKGQHIMDFVNINRGGRPNNKSDSEAFLIFDMYVDGSIGSKKMQRTFRLF